MSQALRVGRTVLADQTFAVPNPFVSASPWFNVRGMSRIAGVLIGSAGASFSPGWPKIQQCHDATVPQLARFLPRDLTQPNDTHIFSVPIRMRFARFAVTMIGAGSLEFYVESLPDEDDDAFSAGGGPGGSGVTAQGLRFNHAGLLAGTDIFTNTAPVGPDVGPAARLTPVGVGKFRVTVSVGAAANLSVTAKNGATEKVIALGALVAGQAANFAHEVEPGLTYDYQLDDNVSIDLLQVDEVDSA